MNRRAILISSVGFIFWMLLGTLSYELTIGDRDAVGVAVAMVAGMFLMLAVFAVGAIRVAADSEDT
jgi:hypothetical protein